MSGFADVAIFDQLSALCGISVVQVSDSFAHVSQSTLFCFSTWLLPSSWSLFPRFSLSLHWSFMLPTELWSHGATSGRPSASLAAGDRRLLRRQCDSPAPPSTPLGPRARPRAHCAPTHALGPMRISLGASGSSAPASPFFSMEVREFTFTLRKPSPRLQAPIDVAAGSHHRQI